MSDTIIKIENISKLYRLGSIGTQSIQGDLARWWAKVSGKTDPFEKFASNNSLSKKENTDIVWALKDINLEVKQGEVIGIIGKNGAGKSTLLKILSRVTAPTKGTITVKGRIASLLEVGTGFHPELTGRENIFLNGAILGMTKHEIKLKFDEIIFFAGIEKYIDTPVKRYSSGMYVRLAFAVAAHLEPEILIIDEVLAVGDAEFQKKCLGKMKDISGQGRTVLFVSHNMSAINTLCQKTCLLSEGQVAMYDRTEKVTSEYYIRNYGTEEQINVFYKKFSIITPIVSLNEARIHNKGISRVYPLRTSDEFTIEIIYTIFSNSYKPTPQIVLENSKSEIVFVSSNYIYDFSLGQKKATVTIPANFLNSGIYYINIKIVDMNPVEFHISTVGFIIDILDDYESLVRATYKGDIPGTTRPLLQWEVM